MHCNLHLQSAYLEFFLNIIIRITKKKFFSVFFDLIINSFFGLIFERKLAKSFNSILFTFSRFGRLTFIFCSNWLHLNSFECISHCVKNFFSSFIFSYISAHVNFLFLNKLNILPLKYFTLFQSKPSDLIRISHILDSRWGNFFWSSYQHSIKCSKISTMIL